MKSQKLLVPINFDGLLTIAQFYARMNGVEWRYEARTYPPDSLWGARLKRLIIRQCDQVTDGSGLHIEHTSVVVEEGPFANYVPEVRRRMGEWDYDVEVRSYVERDEDGVVASIPPWFAIKKMVQEGEGAWVHSSFENYASLFSHAADASIGDARRCNWDFEAIRDIFKRLSDPGCNREGSLLILWYWQEEDFILRDVTSEHGKPMIELEYLGDN